MVDQTDFEIIILIALKNKEMCDFDNFKYARDIDNLEKWHSDKYKGGQMDYCYIWT